MGDATIGVVGPVDAARGLVEVSQDRPVGVVVGYGDSYRVGRYSIVVAAADGVADGGAVVVLVLILGVADGYGLARLPVGRYEGEAGRLRGYVGVVAGDRDGDVGGGLDVQPHFVGLAGCTVTASGLSMLTAMTTVCVGSTSNKDRTEDHSASEAQSASPSCSLRC